MPDHYMDDIYSDINRKKQLEDAQENKEFDRDVEAYRRGKENLTDEEKVDRLKDAARKKRLYNDISGSINVGALSCTTRTDGKERKDFYSNKGPGIDIYAPAHNTISADSFKKEIRNQLLLQGYLSSPFWAEQPFPTYVTMYVPDSEKKAIYNWFGGTSSATPNVAGVLALFLQQNRTASTTEAKEWLLGTSSNYSTAGSYIDTNIVNDTYSNFWGTWDTFTTYNTSINEQTFDVGDDGESIVLDANAHVAYTETADALLDTNIKILYNPYHDIIEYDSDYGMGSGDGLTFSGVDIKYT